MKKSILLLLCLVCFLPEMGASPQNQKKNTAEERKAQFEAIRLRKIAYITEQVGLTSDEAQEFWPIYNQKNQEMEKANKNRRMASRHLRSLFDQEKSDQLSEEQILENKALFLDSFSQEQEIRLRYDKILSTILSPEKIAKLYIAEDRFNDIIIKEFFSRQGGK